MAIDYNTLAKANGAVSSVPLGAQPQGGIDYNALAAQNGAIDAPQTQAQPTPPTESFNPLLDYGHEINAAKDNIVSSITHGANDIQAGMQKGGLKGVPDVLKGTIGAGLGVAAGGVQAIFAPITAPLHTLISSKIGKEAISYALTGNTGAIDEIAKSKPVQDAMTLISSWTTQHPELAKTLSDAFTVGTAGIGGEAAVLKTGVKSAAVSTKNAVAESAIAAKNSLIKTPAERVVAVAKDWKKPAEINSPGYNNARAVLAKAPDSPTFLAKQGIVPTAHVEDGKYLTTDSAQALRDTAGKMSSDTLRPSLRMADYITPKIPVAELEQNAMTTARNQPHITASDMNSIVDKIKSESAALGEKYPNGLSLTNLHDEKITYAKNSGYSAFKSVSDSNIATANRSFSDALATTLEHKAPPSVPVEDFNKYLSNYYKAADYLDALNGKKAPVTILQQGVRYGAKIGGAIVGGHLGGGVATEFAGYQIGKALEHAAENLTNPMRASFLANLEKSNPKAFALMQEYLRSQKEGNTNIKRLTAPKAIIPPAPSEATQMRGRANSIPK